MSKHFAGAPTGAYRPARTAFRARLLATSLIVATLGATPAFAQDSDEPQDADEAAAPATGADEGIVVTGSRIVRANLDNPTPTVVVDDTLLNQQGLQNFADIAATLPQFAPSFGTTRTSSSFSGSTASGLNTTNLRNLGAIRSVVLINGRRVPGGTNLSTAVDFNTLPTANIDRIEIVTGGASAVYGADAVAGVVNIITRSDFTGLELGASYGIAERGYNKNPNAYLMFGSGLGDGGHALFTLQYTYEGLVSCAQAYICNTDIRYNDPDEGPVRAPGTGITGSPPFSGVVPGGRFFIGSGSLTRNLQTGQLQSFVLARDGFNRNPQRTLAIPTRRLMFAGEVDYPITDSITAFAEFNYGRSNTNGPIEAIPFQSSTNLFGGLPGIPGLAPTIPVNNPYFIAATTPAQRAALTPAQIANGIDWSQRLSELGRRGSHNERTTTRAVAGLRGDFAIGESTWNWEASYVYGRTRLDSLTDGLVGTDRLYYGLRVEADPAQPGKFRCTDAGARAQGCVPINPFAPYTQDQIDYLVVTAGQSGVSTLHDFTGFVSGSPFSLPAGDVNVALGVEYRTFSGYETVDEPIRLGLTTGNVIGNTDFVKTRTREAYGEIVVPVLRDASFTKSLELEAGYRISDPNRGGNYETWKVGGTWEPVTGVRFRGMRARAVRAPTPGELGGIGQTFGTVEDPCRAVNRNANPTRAANCTADGVPANYDPPLTVQQSVSGTIGGNPDLEPEKALTWTYGVVLTPAFLPGFSLTVDRFDIKIDGFINTVGRQAKVNLCYDTTTREFCNDIQRGPRSELPGANYALVAINDQLLNVSKFRVKGFDVEARYSFEPGFNLFGEDDRLTLQALSTIYDKAEQTQPDGSITKLDGYAGGDTSTQGFIRWQATGNINYRSGPIDLTYSVRYIPKTEASPFLTGFPKIPAADYHNLRIAFNVSEQNQFYLGVNNLFDRKPPIVPDNASGSQAQNTISGFYDVFGRSFFVGTRLNF